VFWLIYIYTALWHGISPGYYLTFISASFVQTIAKQFRRHVRPLFLNADGKTPGPYKRAYDIFGILATQLAFSYIVAPFIMLSFASSIKVWARVWFYGHVGILIAMAFFNSPGKKWLVKMQRDRVGERMRKSASMDGLIRTETTGPLGLPENPQMDLEEIRTEVMRAVEKRRTGLTITTTTTTATDTAAAAAAAALKAKVGKK
jgi:lysophospholipid acyltransferase